MAEAGTQRMAELLCRTNKLPLLAALLQTAPMDLDAHPKTTIPKGLYRMGIPEQVHRGLLADP